MSKIGGLRSFVFFSSWSILLIEITDIHFKMPNLCKLRSFYPRSCSWVCPWSMRYPSLSRGPHFFFHDLWLNWIERKNDHWKELSFTGMFVFSITWIFHPVLPQDSSYVGLWFILATIARGPSVVYVALSLMVSYQSQCNMHEQSPDTI